MLNSTCRFLIMFNQKHRSRQFFFQVWCISASGIWCRSACSSRKPNMYLMASSRSEPQCMLNMVWKRASVNFIIMPLMARSHMRKILKNVLLPQLPLSCSRESWFLTRNTATFHTKECSAHVFFWEFHGVWSIYVFNPFVFVCDIKDVLISFFYLYLSSFPSTTFWRLSFLYCLFLPLFSLINWPEVYDSEFSILFHWSVCLLSQYHNVWLL